MSTSNELSIPQSSFDDVPPGLPIIERVGRAGGMAIRWVRDRTTKTTKNGFNKDYAEIENIPDEMVGLDLTDTSEARAEAFGLLTVEELNYFEVKVAKYIKNTFELFESEIPYGVISTYISTLFKEGYKEAKSELDAEISFDLDLVDKGVTNCLNAIGVADRMSEMSISKITDFVRQRILKVGFGTIMETVKVNPITNKHLAMYLVETEAIELQRGLATKKMNENYCEVVSEWREVNEELSDEELAKYFNREKFDKRYLSTYFDTCQFGIINMQLVKEAEKFARNNDFDEILDLCKSAIVNHLEEADDINEGGQRRFTPKNCAFTRNGTNAFRLFYDKYLDDGDKVCVSSEEYGEMTKMLKYDPKDKNSKKLNVTPPLPVFAEGVSEDSYVEKVRKHVEKHKPDYLLISVVSRRGTVFPLEKISEVLKNGSHKVNLILDGCQTVGRRRMDFNKIRPDVFIGSCQKGTDLGGPVGILAVASDYVENKGKLAYCEGKKGNPYMKLRKEDKEKLRRIYQLEWNNNQEIGTLSTVDMARFMYGIDPESLRLALDENDDELPECLIKSVEVREKTNHDLACNFLNLLWAINHKEENEDRIKIFHPVNVYSETGKVQEDRVSNIFECKIKGLHLTNKKDDGKTIRKDENGKDVEDGIVEIAAAFGVTIQDYFDQAEEGVSFRIAFHPFMSNESIKLLGFALEKCCEIAKEREGE